MNHVHYVFETTDFIDDTVTRTRNVNEIIGHDLAVWLSGELRRRGFAIPDLWDEDHGWDFFVRQGEHQYLVACSINEAEVPGEAHEGHVSISKQRGMLEVLLGRNKMSAADPVEIAIHEILAAHPAIAGLARD